MFGFCSIVLRGIADIRPDYVAVAFDLQGPTFRHEQYAEYKATRQRMPDDLRDQFPKVREVVKALRIPVYELAGYEADDVIGTITVDAERRGLDTTIVTGDLDMLQLVTDHTRLMTTRSGVENTILYDPARIAERFELVPGQMIDYKALKGDPTDNIPGVPGVGEKTAAKLIREFGTLEALYERIDEVKPDKLRDKLVEHRESVFMGQDLSTIVRDLPVEFDLEAARLGDYDRETVIRLFREYEFRTLIERLPAMTGESAARRPRRCAAWPPTARCRPARVAGRARPSGWGPGSRRVRCRRQAASSSRSISMRSAAAAPRDGPARATTARPCRRRPRHRQPATCRPRWPPRSPTRPDRGRTRRADRRARSRGSRPSRASGSALLADDPRPRRGTPLALALAGDGRPGRRGRGRRRRDRPAPAPRPPRDAGRRPRGQAAARGARSWTTRRPTATPVAFDTQIAAYVLNASLRSQTIADVVAEQLDLILPPVGRADRPARAGLEALSALAVREPLERRLVEDGLDRLYAETRAAAHRGPGTDGGDRGRARPRGAARCSIAEFGAEISRLEKEIYVDVGHEFNLGSPKQLEQILFYELNLPKGKRTKTGYSTDASVLEDLRAAHPMIDKLLEWRIYTKLRSTYVEALPTLLAGDGRLHTTFHQAVAATGRLSSSDPNLQNIPIRTPLGRRIRRAFVAGAPGPDAGRRRLQPDRAAHPRPRLGRRAPQRRVRARRDLHRETAALVLHKDPAEVTLGRAVDGQDGQLRDRLRAVGLRALRAREHPAAGGAGVHQHRTSRPTPASATTCSRSRSRRGRRVRDDAARPQAPDPRASPRATRRSARPGERMAINMPIQGTAADIVKIAMIRLDERLAAGGLPRADAAPGP